MSHSPAQAAGAGPHAETAAYGRAKSAPVVIYIAGSGRSGSTILERTLGEMPGFVNVGELIDLFWRVAPRSERCGCGQVFASCPFWTGVGARAFGGWESEHLAAVHRLQSRVARQRHLPRLVALSHSGRDFRADVTSYGRDYASLYQAIAAEAGADYIVDASKRPAQALALARSGIDVRVIHLVRDVRGVAYSLSKHVTRPHAVAETDVMSHRTPAGAAARWVACQSEVALLGPCGLPVTRMRYEDFVTQPRRSIEQALTELGLPSGPSDLSHIGDGQIFLGRSHGLSGNPSRFREGAVTLQADELWRSEMSARDRRIVTAIGLPHLLSRRPGPRETGHGPEHAPAAHAQAAHAQAAHAPVTDVLATGVLATGVLATDAPATGATETRPAREPASWPLVSVITPTRGRPELLRETIASVVSQTYPGPIECIVVHDQEPPEPELAHLGTELHKVLVTTNEHAPGLAGARNTGLDLAAGDYIATCDDDDTWHPEKLLAQITRLLDEPDLLVVGAGLRFRLPGGKFADWPGRAERISYDLLLRNRVKELHSSTLVMRRDAFAKAGRYDEKLPRGYAEDYDWVLRAARVGHIGTVIQPLADIRKEGQSWYRESAQNAVVALEYILVKHPDIKASRRGHARLLGQIAFARSTLGERRQALPYAIKALILWPASPHPYIALAHIATGIDPQHFRRVARRFGRGMA
jgi:glycosyltransferase involved in cell wall biosynthesis